jgi:NADPH:quinone reductase-like Zn-dependent oxidoreductase
MKFRATRVAAGAAFSVLALAAVDASAATTMRAAVVKDGVIAIQSVPMPEPGAGQVRVRVRAASVNPVDWKVAGRAAPGASSTPGRDFAGVIDAVGPSVTKWKVGDAVTGIGATGTYAEYALAPADAIAAKPAKMSFAEAAGLGVVAETAWRAIVTLGDVQKGQKVLIHGGAGGVGSSAVQIAKARGAYVIATASARNHEFVKSLGADEAIDYKAVRFEDKVKSADLVLNTVDAETSARSVAVVKPGGMLVSIVGAPPAEPCAAAKIRCAETGKVNGTLLGSVVELADAGKFHISVEKRMPLADAAKAWDESRSGHVRGKIILDVTPETT